MTYETGLSRPRPARRKDGIPTRNDRNYWSPAESAIQRAVEAVEEAGAAPALTDAVVLLAKARGRVADFYEAHGEAVDSASVSSADESPTAPATATGGRLDASASQGEGGQRDAARLSDDDAVSVEENKVERTGFRVEDHFDVPPEVHVTTSGPDAGADWGEEPCCCSAHLVISRVLGDTDLLEDVLDGSAVPKASDDMRIRLPEANRIKVDGYPGFEVTCPQPVSMLELNHFAGALMEYTRPYLVGSPHSAGADE